MRKKVKQLLTETLEQHIRNKYYDHILKVEILDKKRCKITVEVDEHKKPINIVLPIATLGFYVKGKILRPFYF